MIRNRFAILLGEKATNEKRHISIAEVSRQTKIAQRTLQAWYSNKIGRYDVPVIFALCCYFDVKPGDLIILDEPCPSQS